VVDDSFSGQIASEEAPKIWVLGAELRRQKQHFVPVVGRLGLDLSLFPLLASKLASTLEREKKIPVSLRIHHFGVKQAQDGVMDLIPSVLINVFGISDGRAL